MVINFDEYKEGEDITIISDGLVRTYKNPHVIFQRNKPLVIPPLNNTEIKIQFTDELIKDVSIEVNGDCCLLSKV